MLRLHLGDNHILSKTFYTDISLSASSMKSPELPKIDSKGFHFRLLNQENDNVKARKVRGSSQFRDRVDFCRSRDRMEESKITL